MSYPTVAFFYTEIYFFNIADGQQDGIILTALSYLYLEFI